MCGRWVRSAALMSQAQPRQRAARPGGHRRALVTAFGEVGVERLLYPSEGNVVTETVVSRRG